MQQASPTGEGNNTARGPEMAIAFGPFVLHRAQKLLLQGNLPVRLGSRALEILVALVEHAGETLNREFLEARVWPNTVVEETSLRVHISALRKALGDGQDGRRYINNLPSRGYCFVTPVTLVPVAALASLAATPPQIAPGEYFSLHLNHNLPVGVTRAIGRADVITALGGQLARQRLVSIVGPGGMGKTTVALAVAREHLGAYEHGAWFVDLAPVTDGALVPATLATVLGTSVPPVNPWPALAAFLADSHRLIVLDNCEHVIDAAAQLAEQLLHAAPGVHILSTSREPLQADGEWVHRLASLDLPTTADTLTTPQALAYPAIELFVERASANAYGFALSDSNLHLVRHLCRQLDGMPLAIELAAARVDGLGVQGLATHLEDVFRLLTRGRRTALPRHRTLQALIDWSHDLLNDTERAVLRRLSVFRAGFTLESASTVCSCSRIGPAAVIESVMSLCARSLVAVDPCAQANSHSYSHARTHTHRLLYTTHTYARERLAASGEQAQLHQRHAVYFHALMERANAAHNVIPIADWLAEYTRVMDDVRAGLHWTFSPAGDALLGVLLTTAAMDLMLELSLFDEFRRYVATALEQVRLLSAPQPELELRLSIAMLFSTAQTSGSPTQSTETLERTTQLAAQVNSPRHRVDLLHSMCANTFGGGQYLALEDLAERIALHSADPSESMAILLSHRFLAMSRHYLGHHRDAWRLAHLVIDYPAAYAIRRYAGWAPRTVSMGILLARICWMEGRSDQAVRLADDCLEQAAGNSPHILCMTLALAALPIALWRGDLQAASQLADALHAQVTRHSLSFWHSWAKSFSTVLAVRTHTSHSPEIEPLMADWSPPVSPMALDMFGTLAHEMLAPAGLARVDSGQVGWNAPEVLRAHGENLLRQCGPSNAEITVKAESFFMRALQLARQQNVLAWELRTAISLSRLWHTQGRDTEASELLLPVYTRFTEGFDTADLMTARRLLHELPSPPLAPRKAHRV